MTQTFFHRNVGTCSASVRFAIVDGRIHGVSFEGGCSGNLQGIASLVEGMDPVEAERRLSGISCGGKPTSCPDQFAAALREALSLPR